MIMAHTTSLKKRGMSLLLALLLALSLSSGVFAASGETASAEVKEEFTIQNDGYGYLTANFPSEYPAEYLQEKVTNTEILMKVDALMLTLTDEEKIGALAGSMNSSKTYGTGYWEGIPRVGIPVIRNYDGPMGVRGNAGYETSRPANELSVASSFDTDVAFRYGALYAADNRANAGNMQLGIQTDLVRKLSTMRARDMFGEDWYLEGQIASAMADGLEKHHVLACLKHLGGMANIDEQSMMENYLSVYEIILKDDNAAHTIMTNYGATNGQQACADRYVLKDVLRDMWGWQGIAISDWSGNYQFSVDDGLTIETPNGVYNNPEAIQMELDDGTITMDDVDQAVRYILYSLGKAGYLGLVTISRDGDVAVDNDPPAVIDLPDASDEERAAIREENVQAALETSEAGVVLLKNEGGVLPLNKDSGSIALLGQGAVYTVAGHMHECAFGVLDELAVSPYDALTELMPDAEIAAYAANDIVGEAIGAEYLYTDAAATHSGVLRTGTDGFGVQNDGEDAAIDFVTNSTDYKNAADGTAFEYGSEGVHYTWTTYLKAPESGTYTMKVEAIGAGSVSGSIEINGAELTIPAACGDVMSGGYGSSGLVTSKTGLDIPAGASGEPSGEASGESAQSITLEEGKTYKITVSVDGSIADRYSYLRGKKDTQVRLAWITPSQEEQGYADAIAAAGNADTVVLFAYALESLSIDQTQAKLLTEAIEAAKAAGNKVVLVVSSALPVNITEWVDDCDAIVETWLPGQSGGKVIANILTGAYNPSGKLCVTWPKNFSDDQSAIETSGRGVIIPASHPGANVPTEIREGIFNGYKWYDATDKDDSVLFDFGYGLSYTDFSYELESVTPNATGADTYGYDFNVKVTNTGKVAGSEAVQLYIGAPEAGAVENAIYSPYDVADSFRYVYEDGTDFDYAAEGSYENAAYFVEIDGVQFAERQLAGFAHTELLQPGESETVTIHVTQRGLSYWNSDADYTQRSDGTMDKWTVVEGSRTFYVSKASDNDVLVQEVAIAPAK